MAESKLRVNLIGDASSLNRSLQIASARLETFGKRATQVGKDLSLRLSLPIGIAAGAAIKMASDMEESTNKVRVAFGSSSKEVEEFAKTALRSFGIAESSALDMTALFGDMATGMGISRSEAATLSTSLVGLAGDLASFKNINISEVTTALSGVFTGETESLKRLGIVMTEVNLKQFALQQGITKTIKEMTQQEKIMLRMQYIFSVTGNAQGDFARTSEGAANQMRIFQESLKEVGAELGNIMLPVFTQAITKVNDLLKEFRELDKGTQENIVKFGLLVAAIPPVIFVMGQLAKSLKAIGNAVIFLTGTSGIPKLIALLRTLSGIKLSGIASAVAALLTLRGDTRVDNERLDAAIKAVETEKERVRLLKEAAKVFGGATVEMPAPVLPFGKGDKIKMPTPLGEDQALNNMIVAADKAAASLDELLATDSNLTFALASDAAAVEFFGNVVKQTAEEVRTPMEAIKEKTKELSEGAVNFLMQVGSALQSAFMDMMEGENPIKALGKAIGDLIKRLIAAAAAAAVVSLIISSITGAPMGTTFKGVFGGMTGITGFANGGIVSTPTLGLMGEYNGARSNPEVIAPLDRLQSLMGGGRQEVSVTGQFRLDGQDLVVAVERANNQRSNFTG